MRKGDKVTINTPDNPARHGKTGVVVGRLAADKTPVEREYIQVKVDGERVARNFLKEQLTKAE